MVRVMLRRSAQARASASCASHRHGPDLSDDSSGQFEGREQGSRQMNEASGEPSIERLTAYREVLTVWHYSSHFQGIVEALGKQIPTPKLWGNRYKFVREAMTLAEFAKLSKNVTDVRLGSDPPDGSLRLFGGKELSVEVTEVLEPDRKRGDEYGENQVPSVDDLTEEELETRIQTIEPQLEKAIEGKVDKYPFEPTLLIYLNIVDHGRAQKRIEAAIARQKAKYSSSFADIHVIWKAKLY
jgi:hypothetical protein